MNNDQRIEFWKTLCSLDGKDLQADQNKLKEKIVFPRFIYRYREVTSNNLDALRSNRLFFSSANYYDDPFDTFLYIDKKRLQKNLTIISKALKPFLVYLQNWSALFHSSSKLFLLMSCQRK